MCTVTVVFNNYFKNELFLLTMIAIEFLGSNNYHNTNNVLVIFKSMKVSPDVLLLK